MSRVSRRLAVVFGSGLLVMTSLSPASSWAASESAEDYAEIGDWVQILLPASGYVGTWITGDKEGAYQLTKALAGAGISAHFFKQLAERTRPDATDTRSFPSGHTTAAFAGSEFIRIRWGNGWGIPATLAAGFVGWSRINVNKHFRDDVLAGMSNGLMWNWYMTTPANQSLNVRPASVDGGYGFEVSYTFDGKPDTRPNTDFQSKPKFTYRLEWGPTTQDTNIYISPVETGTTIDLATAEDEFDFTSRVSFEHFFADRHEWGLYVAPMEIIEFDPGKVLTEPALFAGKVFLPNDEAEFESRYNFVEARATYRYRLVDTSKWSVRLGIGAAYQQSVLDIRQFLGSPKDGEVLQEARANLEQFKVLGSIRASYAISDRWWVDFEADGFGGDDTYLNSALLFGWRAAPEWELGFGFRYIDREVNDEDIYNKLQVGDVVLTVTHGFF